MKKTFLILLVSLTSQLFSQNIKLTQVISEYDSSNNVTKTYIPKEVLVLNVTYDNKGVKHYSIDLNDGDEHVILQFKKLKDVLDFINLFDYKFVNRLCPIDSKNEYYILKKIK